MSISSNKRLLITGATGFLGRHLIREFASSGCSIAAWSRVPADSIDNVAVQSVDLSKQADVVEAFRAVKPDLVIHAGAISNAEKCASDANVAWKVNADSTALIAELAEEQGARLLFVSSDWVFDGRRGCYREDDATAPETIYGQTKVRGEEAVLAIENSIVVRFSLLFGSSRGGQPTFFDRQVAAIRQSMECKLFEDEWRSPLSVLAAARALKQLISTDVPGILHVAGSERLSRLEFGQRLTKFLGKNPERCIPTRQADYASPEPRPMDTSLNSEQWHQICPRDSDQTIEEQLEELL